MNNNNSLWIVIVVLAACVVALAGYVYVNMNPRTATVPGNNGGPVACTMEAKQCPDGSYVGRQGPNCEFAACPTGVKVQVK